MTESAPLNPPASVLRALGESRARQSRRIVFTGLHQDHVLEAALGLGQRDLIHPVLVGDATRIHARASELGLSDAGVEILAAGSRDDYRDAWRAELASQGVRAVEADASLKVPETFARAMVRAGGADGVVYGPGVAATPAPPGARRGARWCFVLVGSRRAGVGLVAAPMASSVPSAMALVETALATADLGKQLTGSVPEMFFLAPGVPVSLERRGRFQSARDELRERVHWAAETVRVRMGDSGVAPGLHFDLSELSDSSDGKLRCFVLTETRSIAGIRGALDAVWSVGPLYQGLDGVWGEVSDQDSPEQIRLISVLAALSVEVDEVAARSTV